MIRLFVGLELPRNLRERLALLSGVPGARWRSAEQMHLTLRFIGEVDESRASDIEDALGEISHTPFTIALKGVGIFGQKKAPYALWAGVSPVARLAALRDKIERQLVLVGEQAETRKFSPHVTLAYLTRTENGQLVNFLADHDSLESPPFEVDEFVLFSSFLSQNGAIYTAEARYPLTAH